MTAKQPSSADLTLVAEILILRQLLEGKDVLFMFPFVISLISRTPTTLCSAYNTKYRLCGQLTHLYSGTRYSPSQFETLVHGLAKTIKATG